jgi:hypothetical protein
MIELDWMNVAGYGASFLVFCAFYMKAMVPLRVIAIASNLAFVVYGLGHQLYPVLILHTLLLPVNCTPMSKHPGHETGADRIEFEERVQALYRQGGRAGWASVVVALCLVAVMWRFVASDLILAWLSLTLAVVAIRVPLLRAHARDPQRERRAKVWARRYTWMVLAHGTCWGLASILFLDAASPLGVASFLVVAALVPTANVATQANHLPAVYAILFSRLVPTVLRLALLGGGQFVPLAATLSLYLTFLVAFARLQSRTIGSGIRLRLENLALIGALQVEKEQAEAQRERAEHSAVAPTATSARTTHPRLTCRSVCSSRAVSPGGSR